MKGLNQIEQLTHSLPGLQDVVDHQLKMSI